MKKHTYLIPALLLFYFGRIIIAYADDVTPDPQELINEMSKASRDLNYDGVFMYRLGKQIDTMRIIHKSGTNGIYERLVSLTGHAREVVRDKDEVKCIFPEKKSVVVDRSRAGKLVSGYLPNPIQSISDYYDFEIAGEDRIAGIDAWIVNIRPVDKYRYGYQIWIAKDSKLLLKSELKNQLGITLEQIMFAQLNILDEVDDELLKPSTLGKDFTWYNNIGTKEEKSVNKNEKQWQVTWMPDGFTMSEHAMEPMRTSHTPVEHLVYTDGLAMVSIFVEKLNEQPTADAGPTQFGGVNAYAVQSDDYQITAVGEVPKATVKLMADSVKSLH